MKVNNDIDSKGKEIIKKIERKKYSIKFVKQDNMEKNLEGLYDVIAELLVDSTVNEPI